MLSIQDVSYACKLDSAKATAWLERLVTFKTESLVTAQSAGKTLTEMEKLGRKNAPMISSRRFFCQ